MATIGALNVELRTNTAKFAQGLNRANRHMDGFARSARQLRNLVGGLFVGISFKAIIDATAKQEQAMKQLEQAVESTGGIAGFTAKELADLAGSLQDVTTYGDEAIIAMQAILLTFTNLRGDILPQTTEAVLNLAARMGTDLNSAALQLGKALNDPVANLGALSRAGIQFNKDQKALIKTLSETGRIAEAQGVILEELETQFGGAARAARDTMGGALQGLQNAFGDLLEAKGGLNDAKESIETLTALLKDPATVEAINTLTSALISGFKGAAEVMRDAVFFAESLGENFAREMHGSIDSLDFFERKVEALHKTLALMSIEEQTSFFPSFGFEEDFDEKVREMAEAAKTYQQLLRDMDQPITPIEPEEIKNIVPPLKEVETQLKINAESAEEYGKRMYELARLGYPAATETAEEYGQRMKENAEEMLRSNTIAKDLGFTFSSAFEDAIVEGGKLRDILKGLEQDILRIITRQLVTQPLAEGITGIIGSYFGGARAMGGPVSANQAYLVGERGPELFMPKQSGDIVPNSKLGGQTVINNNFTIQAPEGRVSRESQQQIATQVGLVTRRAMSRNS